MSTHGASSAPAPSARRATLLAGLLPAAPFVIAIVAYLPLAAPEVVSLRGTWQAFDDDQAPLSMSVGAIDVDAVALRIPGRLAPATTKIARHFELPADADVAAPWLLLFGGVSNGVADVYVNGAFIGSEGVAAAGYKMEHIGLESYSLPPGHLRRGENTVVVAVAPEGDWTTQPRIAIVDQRLLLGPARLVRPWYDRAVALERLLQLGGMLLLAFVTALVLALSAAEQEHASRRVQWATGALSLSIVLYLMGKSGLAVSLGSARDIIPIAVSGIGLCIPEMLERAFLGDVTAFQRVNRIVCSTNILLLLFFGTNALVYLAFIPWLFVIMGRGLFVALRGMRRQPNIETVLLAGSSVAMVGAGVNDLLTDLGMITTPRLFTLAAVDMAIVGAVFVVGRFLRAMVENTRLIGSLADKNHELVTALDRAEESTRMKSAFLANTSHELRTPLNSIINVPEGLLEEFTQRPFMTCSSCKSLFEIPDGYVAAATEACPECSSTGTLSMELRAVFSGDPDAAMRYLRAIQQSGRHLLAVVTDILDFSKIEAGRMMLHFEEVTLNDVLEKLAIAMGPLADTRRITLNVDSVEPSVRLDTDAVKLTQALMNLVSNAIKFSPDDSEVAVVVVVGATSVSVSVVDHGIGIAEADRARVFESFLQLDNSHTRKVGGTGLGLAITKKIVEMMHGTLRIDSTVIGGDSADGSTFVIELPLRQPVDVAAVGP